MDKRPNILVFFTDQQRWDTCGCYGQQLPITPHLDRMAAEGVRFDQAYTCQPVCGPARAAMQTGQYPTRLDCHTNHRLLPLDADTIAKRLNEAGYATGYIGKWHLASYGVHGGADDFRTRPIPTERRGGYRDFWLASDTLEFTSHGYGGYMYDGNGHKREWDESTYRVDAQTDWLLEHLDQVPDDRPFFTFVSYIEPHHQNDRDTYEGPHGSKEQWRDYQVPGDLEGTEGDWREHYPDYLGCCHALDQALGRVLAKLEEQGKLENTVILFTSDHGSHFRTRNNEYKRSCHDASLHIPMVARGPGFGTGKVAELLCSNLDIPGTVLRAAGLEVPEHYDGGALQDVAANRLNRNAIYVQISESQCGRAIRTQRWTYSVRAPDGTATGHTPASETYREDYLYDNQADPHQRTNLVADPAYAGVRAQLRERLLEHLVAAGETKPTIVDATPSPFEPTS